MMISVIIPVYNVKDYVLKCLESVHNQTFSDYEVIIVNDGSTDGSETICKEYIKDKTKFMIIDQANAGLSAARNVGVTNSRGDFIFFIDSDDWLIDENVLSRLFTVAKEGIIVKGRIVCSNRKSKSEPKLFSSPLCFSACNCLIPRDCLMSVGLFECGRINEDVILMAALYSKYNVEYIDIPTYVYYQRQGSIQNSRFDERRFGMLYSVKQALQSIEKGRNPNKMKRTLVLNLYSKQLYGVLLVIFQEKNFINNIQSVYKYYVELKRNCIKHFVSFSLLGFLLMERNIIKLIIKSCTLVYFVTVVCCCRLIKKYR